MIAFFVSILTVVLFYGIIKCLPGAGIIVLSPFLALKEGVEILCRKKDKAELRYLPVFLNLLRSILLLAAVILFFPVINTYGTFKGGRRKLGVLMIFGCLAIYGTVAFIACMEYLS